MSGFVLCKPALGNKGKGPIRIRFPSSGAADVPAKPRRLRPFCHVLLVLLCFNAAACSQYTSLHNPQFSPCSSILAYVADTWRVAHVCWSKVDDLKDPKCVRLSSVDASWDDLHLHKRVHLVFSPDSRHLAVASPKELRVIDLTSGKSRLLSHGGEFVSSLAWMGKDQVAYVAHTSRRGKFGEISDRTFWRQQLQPPAGKRAVIYREKKTVTGVGYFPVWPLEHWSPDGRFVIFASPYLNGQFKLLDVQKGTTTAFGKCDKLAALVAWKPDSSAAVCVGGAWPPQAIVVDPRRGATTDISTQFVKAFGEYPPKEMPGWTADGKFLIVNDIGRQGCLVQIEPWKVLPTGKRVFDKNEGRYWQTGFVYPLPTPGRVLIRSTTPDHPKWCLADYTGRRLAAIPKSERWSERCGDVLPVSPDGKKFATGYPRGSDLAEAIAEGFELHPLPPELPPVDASRKGPASRESRPHRYLREY